VTGRYSAEAGAHRGSRLAPRESSLPIEAAGREGRRGGAFPEGAGARGGEGTAFDPALILTFFLALLWTCWGAQSLIASIGDQCEPVLSLL